MYLGLHLNRRLAWHKHIFAKRKQLGITLTKIYWLLGCKSKLFLHYGYHAEGCFKLSLLYWNWNYRLQIEIHVCCTNLLQHMKQTVSSCHTQGKQSFQTFIYFLAPYFPKAGLYSLHAVCVSATSKSVFITLCIPWHLRSSHWHTS
jgi:hypothetical protein